jgi:hypothetical protein
MPPFGVYMDFKAQFQAKVTDTFNQANAIYALGVDEMFNKIIEETPVDTGFARASWWKSINEIGSHPSPPIAVEKGESVAQAPQIGTQLAKITLKDKVYLSTACEYMPKIEYGYSRKHGKTGWIRVIVGQAGAYFKQSRVIVKNKGIQ